MACAKHRLQFNASIFQLLTPLQLSEKRLKKTNKKIPSPSPTAHLHSSCIPVVPVLGEHTEAEQDLQSEILFCEKPGCSPHCQLSAKLISFFCLSCSISPTFFLEHAVLRNVYFCVTASYLSHSPWRREHQRVGLGLDFRKMPGRHMSWYPTLCSVPWLLFTRTSAGREGFGTRFWSTVSGIIRSLMCLMLALQSEFQRTPTSKRANPFFPQQRGDVKARGLQLSSWYLAMPSWSTE